MTSLAKFGPVSLEKFFLMLSMVFFFTISLFSPIVKKCCLALYLNKIECPSIKNALGQVCPNGSGGDHFQMLSVCYCYLAFFSLKKAKSFIWTNLNSLPEMRFYANLVNISQMKIIKVYRQVGTQTTCNKKDHKLDL